MAKTYTPSPKIILVSPQLGENIGMCARAMMNCNIRELRLVNPRDPWPNPTAVPTAAGADEILEDTLSYKSTKDAIKDCTYTFACTARSRRMVKPVFTPKEAAKFISNSPNHTFGILFGGESSGLDNEDVTFANAIIQVPLNPSFSSLNLSQAVLLLCYELFQENLSQENIEIEAQNLPSPAPKEDLHGFFDHLEEELSARNFFYPIEKKEKMIQNIRNFYQRTIPTEQDIRTLRGIISYLTRPPKKR